MKKNKVEDSPLSDILIGQVTHLWAEERGLLSDYAPEIDSTSALAKRESEFTEEPLKIYLTDSQTAGRGRNSNTWSNARKGSQLFSTWTLIVNRPVAPTLSPLMGLALYRAVSCTWPFLPWSLKAPNDLYLGSKKVAGILLEAISQAEKTRVLLGLGLNVFDFPQNVKTSTSIAHEMPEATPLLGEDWIGFCERWLFEWSQTLQRSSFELTTTDQLSLLKALNDFPLLENKYTGLTAEASLKTKKKTISWMEI